MNETYWNVVPLKCIQTNGLSTCVVASAADPPQSKYQTNLGSLLISPQVPRPRSQGRRRIVGDKGTKQITESVVAKNSPGGSSSQSDPWATYNSSALGKRVDALEKKISGIEVEQKSTRETVDELKTSQQNGFNSLLAAIHDLKKLQGSSASSSPVPSPPTKQHKPS